MYILSPPTVLPSMKTILSNNSNFPSGMHSTDIPTHAHAHTRAHVIGERESMLLYQMGIPDMTTGSLGEPAALWHPWA